jgi:hypothetical protein
MSATLQWHSSGLGVKTGTARANFINDLATLFNANLSDSNFSWKVASVSTAGNPNYIVIKRKDGSDGRILIVAYTSAPAGSHTVLFDVSAGAIATTAPYVAWFPSGNTDTPSNLTASSGTILGNDANAVKVSPGGVFTTTYAASIQHFYFDSAEAVWFCQQNPSSGSLFMFGAGDLLIDSADNAYGATIGFAGSALGNWGSGGGSSVMAHTTNVVQAGSISDNMIRTNYSSSNRVYFHAWVVSGTWGGVPVSSTDILTDTAANRAYFVPMQLLGQSKGEGFVLKHRQIAIGPGTVGPFQVYQTTGPTVQARQINARTLGAVGAPWLVNFKI